MKQLIARLDDGLHARLKSRATAEGRSLNDLVTEALAAAVGQRLTRQALRVRARATSLVVQPPKPEQAPARQQALDSTRRVGRAASDALDAERAAR